MFPFGSGANPPNRQNYPQQNPYNPNSHSQTPSAPGQMQMPMPFGSGMTGNIGFTFPSDNHQTPQNIQVFPQTSPQANFYGGQASLGYQTSPSFKNPTNYQPSIQNAYQNSGYPAAPQMQMPYQQTASANNSYPNAAPYAQNQYQSPSSNYPNYSPGQINPQSYQNQSFANQNSFQNAPPFGSNVYPNLNNSNLSSFPHTNTARRGFESNQKKEGTPTVLPSPNFDAQADSAACRKAMKGFGTDEDGLINIICRRTNAERQQIAKVFKTNFGKDLTEDIKSECRGNFESLLVACLVPTIDFYCKELRDAISGFGTDEDVLIETLCTLSNNEINIIKENYQRLYGSNLESSLMSDTSGNFKRLLVSLCNANRDESGHVDIDAAKADATELLRAGELRFGTDESTFNRILCQRNYEQLKQICKEYQAITGHSLEDAIKKEFSGDVEDGLIAIIRCVNSKAEFFAKQLHKSMAGLGTTDKQLIRIVVTRCEIDMVEIKEAFERMFGKTLKSFIKGDTSGDYKHGLYALIGENRS